MKPQPPSYWLRRLRGAVEQMKEVTMAKASPKERFEGIVRDLVGALQSEGAEAFLKHYAEVMRRLSRYSPRNVALILAQRRDVSDVRGFRSWKKEGRHVRKGEQAIWIWAPRHKKVTKEDGEEETVFAGFRLVPVFDVSQTEGKEIPTGDPQYTITAPKHLELHDLARAIGRSIASVRLVESLEVPGRFTPGQGLIELRAGMPKAMAMHVLFHEAAHAILHDHKDRNLKQEELEAETAAFIVSHILGIDAKLAASSYLVSYGAKPEELYALLNRVGEAARRILEAVGRPQLAQAA